MCNISFLVAQSHRSHEALHFDGFAGETFTDEGSLRDHAFPRLFLALSRPHDLEYLVFCDTTDFGQRHSIFGRLVLSLLLDRTGQRLGILLALAIEQEGGERAFRYIGGVFLLDVALVVGLEGLLELHFLGMSFRMKKFGLQTEGLLCNGGLPVDSASFTLPSARDKPKKKGRMRCNAYLRSW